MVAEVVDVFGRHGYARYVRIRAARHGVACCYYVCLFVCCRRRRRCRVSLKACWCVLPLLLVLVGAHGKFVVGGEVCVVVEVVVAVV